MSDDVVYVSTAPWRSEHDHVLVLCCSEPRIHQAIEEFLSKHLGLDAADRVVLPGGPQRVLITGAFFFAIEADVRLLHKVHDLRRAVTFRIKWHGFFRTIWHAGSATHCAAA